MEKELTFPFDLSGRLAIYFVQNVQNAVLNQIQIGSSSRRVNAKSLLGVLSLGIKTGDKVSVFYKREEDFVAIEEIVRLLNDER